jgi:uncharacterized membrane protein HdeD (DUF308 family)
MRRLVYSRASDAERELVFAVARPSDVNRIGLIGRADPFYFTFDTRNTETEMSSSIEVQKARRTLRHELDVLRGEWLWFLILGIGLIVVGMIAIGAPLVASLATAITFGVLLLVGGIGQFIGAFWARDWSGFFLALLVSVLYIVLGLLFMRDPGNALMAMTLLLACMLLVEGLFRIIGSLMYQFPYWGWTFAGGAIDVALGLMIWMQWPFSGLWVIGLFVGISMIFNGWTWVTLALALKSMPRPATATIPPTHPVRPAHA